jgi:chromosome segregation and condensation protein ScpB
MSDQPLPESNPLLIAHLEALLFVAPGAVTVAQLAATLDLPARFVEKGLETLRARYLQEETLAGIRLQEHSGRFQLTTAPEFSNVVERFLGLEATSQSLVRRLTRFAASIAMVC